MYLYSIVQLQRVTLLEKWITQESDGGICLSITGYFTTKRISVTM